MEKSKVDSTSKSSIWQGSGQPPIAQHPTSFEPRNEQSPLLVVTQESGNTAYLHLPTQSFRTFDDIVEHYGGGAIPSSKDLEALFERLQKMAEVVENRGLICDKGRRKLAQERKDSGYPFCSLEAIEMLKRDLERRERVKQEAADEEERGLKCRNSMESNWKALNDSRGNRSHAEDSTLGFYAPYQDSEFSGELSEWHQNQTEDNNVPNPTIHGAHSERDFLRNPDRHPPGIQGSQLEQLKSITQEDDKQSASDPEHKGKRLIRKSLKSKMKMTHTDAKPGDYFYVRLKGYPLWPAIVCDESMLPIALLKSRPVTAARQDGTYCDDYEDGGSKVKDRTFPVMYPHTFEFGWIPNYDLIDLDFEDVKNVPANMKKDLYAAYQLAAEQHDLDYFKDSLKGFMEMKEAAQAKRANREADKAAKKVKKAALWTSMPDPAVPTIFRLLFESGPNHSSATGSGAGEISTDLPFPSQASKKTGTKHLLSTIVVSLVILFP